MMLTPLSKAYHLKEQRREIGLHSSKQEVEQALMN